MSNSQNHSLASAVNRLLLSKGVIRVNQQQASYRRLRVIVEAYHVQTVEDLWVYVQRCIAIKAQGGKVAGVDDQPEGPAVPAPAPLGQPTGPQTEADVAVIEGRKPRAPKKPRAKKVGKSVREELDLANSPCYLDRNA